MTREFRQESQLDFRKIADLRLRRVVSVRTPVIQVSSHVALMESFSCTQTSLRVRANRSQRRGMLRPLQASIPRSGFYRLRPICGAFRREQSSLK